MNRLRSLVAMLLLAACASPQPAPQPVVQTQLITPIIAPDLLSCGNAPVAPKAATMQSEVARYIVTLWQWGDGCKSRLEAVRESLAQQ